MPLYTKMRINIAIIFSLFCFSQVAISKTDVVNGEEIFKTQCAACHNTIEGAQPDMYGVVLPLWGVVGSEAGKVPGFFYSKAMRTSDLTWTEENLDEYLENPNRFLPGVRMVYPGLKDNQSRADLIAYLKTAGGQATPTKQSSKNINRQELIKEPMGGEPFGVSLKEVAQGVYVFRWWIYRNLIIVTDEGVVATDPINPKAAKLLKAEISKLTDKPIKYVVYSHNHHDHISGGNILASADTKFVGHANLLKELRDHPSPIIPEPDISFEEKHTIKLGGRTLVLHYLGPNHGDSLVVMHIPEENILFTVDIITPRRVAFRNMPDFWPDEWLRTLREIEAMDVDYVITAHGPQSQPAIDPPLIVTEQREYLEDLMAAVKNAMDSGMRNPVELRQKIKLPKYEHWQFYDEWLPMNIERIWAYYHMGW